MLLVELELCQMWARLAPRPLRQPLHRSGAYEPSLPADRLSAVGVQTPLGPLGHLALLVDHACPALGRDQGVVVTVNADPGKKQ